MVALGIGSNTDPVNNISACLDELLLRFRDLRISSVFESKADGAASKSPYLNLVVGLETELPPGDLARELKTIETKLGRNGEQSGKGIIPIDIDILIYGNKQGNFDGVSVPREEILTKAWILWPLSQVAPKEKHPVRNESYAALWAEFAQNDLDTYPINFTWHGRPISRSDR